MFQCQCLVVALRSHARSIIQGAGSALCSAACLPFGSDWRMLRRLDLSSWGVVPVGEMCCRHGQLPHLCGHACWCGRVGALPPILLKLFMWPASRLAYGRKAPFGHFLSLAMVNNACRGLGCALSLATSVILLILSDLEAFARHVTWLCRFEGRRHTYG